MQLNMFPISKFVELNHCQEITNPIFFNFDKTPTANGLFSYEIFGYSEEERKNIFAYIDLHGWYIHPIPYSMLSSRMSSMKYIISGEKSAIINKQTHKLEIVPDNTPGSGTGLEFIYNNFEEINWIDELEEAEMSSIDKKTRLKFLKYLQKDEFFVDKWLVLPPYYREESAENRSLGDILNQLYKELISATKSMNLGFDFDIFGNQTKRKIQGLLKQIWDVTMGPVTGKSLNKDTGELQGNAKNSLLKRHLIGKTLDYGALTVIVAPQISDAKNIKDFPIPFGYAGITLVSCVGLFKPFFIHEVGNKLEDFMRSMQNALSYDIGTIDPNQFSASNIDKLLTRFCKSENERFDPVLVTYKDKSGKQTEVSLSIYEYATEEDAKNNRNPIVRDLTYMDLIYMTAESVLKDKHCLITRHPVTNNKNIYPVRIKVLSTARTRTVFMRDDIDSNLAHVKKYEYYPYIKEPSGEEQLPKKPSAYYELIGTTLLGNAVLKSLGGDYDGDTVFIRGLFSLQANAEADKMIYAKSNLLGADGSPIRGLTKIGKDCTVTLYCLTKD